MDSFYKCFYNTEIVSYCSSLGALYSLQHTGGTCDRGWLGSIRGVPEESKENCRSVCISGGAGYFAFSDSPTNKAACACYTLEGNCPFENGYPHYDSYLILYRKFLISCIKLRNHNPCFHLFSWITDKPICYTYHIYSTLQKKF